jgi:hypothetical protein
MIASVLPKKSVLLRRGIHVQCPLLRGSTETTRCKATIHIDSILSCMMASRSLTRAVLDGVHVAFVAGAQGDALRTRDDDPVDACIDAVSSSSSASSSAAAAAAAVAIVSPAETASRAVASKIYHDNAFVRCVVCAYPFVGYDNCNVVKCEVIGMIRDDGCGRMQCGICGMLHNQDEAEDETEVEEGVTHIERRSHGHGAIHSPTGTSFYFANEQRKEIAMVLMREQQIADAIQLQSEENGQRARVLRHLARLIATEPEFGGQASQLNIARISYLVTMEITRGDRSQPVPSCKYLFGRVPTSPPAQDARERVARLTATQIQAEWLLAQPPAVSDVIMHAIQLQRNAETMEAAPVVAAAAAAVVAPAVAAVAAADNIAHVEELPVGPPPAGLVAARHPDPTGQNEPDRAIRLDPRNYVADEDLEYEDGDEEKEPQEEKKTDATHDDDRDDANDMQDQVYAPDEAGNSFPNVICNECLCGDRQDDLIPCEGDGCVNAMHRACSAALSQEPIYVCDSCRSDDREHTQDPSSDDEAFPLANDDDVPIASTGAAAGVSASTSNAAPNVNDDVASENEDDGAADDGDVDLDINPEQILIDTVRGRPLHANAAPEVLRLGRMFTLLKRIAVQSERFLTMQLPVPSDKMAQFIARLVSVALFCDERFELTLACSLGFPLHTRRARLMVNIKRQLQQNDGIQSLHATHALARDLIIRHSIRFGISCEQLQIMRDLDVMDWWRSSLFGETDSTVFHSQNLTPLATTIHVIVAFLFSFARTLDNADLIEQTQNRHRVFCSMLNTFLTSEDDDAHTRTFHRRTNVLLLQALHREPTLRTRAIGSILWSVRNRPFAVEVGFDAWLAALVRWVFSRMDAVSASPCVRVLRKLEHVKSRLLAHLCPVLFSVVGATITHPTDAVTNDECKRDTDAIARHMPPPPHTQSLSLHAEAETEQTQTAAAAAAAPHEELAYASEDDDDTNAHASPWVNDADDAPNADTQDKALHDIQEHLRRFRPDDFRQPASRALCRRIERAALCMIRLNRSRWFRNVMSSAVPAHPSTEQDDLALLFSPLRIQQIRRKAMRCIWQHLLRHTRNITTKLERVESVTRLLRRIFDEDRDEIETNESAVHT